MSRPFVWASPLAEFWTQQLYNPRKETPMFTTRQQVAQEIFDLHEKAEEGLEYFILNYSSADAMPDDELKEAFTKAKEALEKFEALLRIPDDNALPHVPQV